MCLPKDREVNNNKYKDIVTAREIWVPSKKYGGVAYKDVHLFSFLLKDM